MKKHTHHAKDSAIHVHNVNVRLIFQLRNRICLRLSLPFGLQAISDNYKRVRRRQPKISPFQPAYKKTKWVNEIALENEP